MLKENPYIDTEHLPSTQNVDVLFFSTENNKVAISSPIKVLILNLVKNGPTPLEIIVERSGRAKSTITKHIQDLEEVGLITSHHDSSDHRKRIIMISAEEIGRLTPSESSIKPGVYYIPDAVSSFTSDDIVSFFRFSLMAFYTQALRIGINIDPVLKQTGVEVGEVLTKIVSDTTIEGIVGKMDTFWKTHGLGKVTLYSTTPLMIQIDECFECSDLPKTGRSACAFGNGILTGIFSDHLKCPVLVVEEECYSKGENRCLFVITPLPDNGSKIAQSA